VKISHMDGQKRGLVVIKRDRKKDKEIQTQMGIWMYINVSDRSPVCQESVK